MIKISKFSWRERRSTMEKEWQKEFFERQNELIRAIAQQGQEIS